MDVFTDEIEQALYYGLHNVAIMACLSLIDICGALGSSNGESTGNKFREWCNNWLPDELTSKLNSSDLWKIRCGMLHQGRFNNGGISYGRIIFTIPPKNPDGTPSIKHVRYHLDAAGDALIVDTQYFCVDVNEAVKKWYDAKKGDPDVVRNYAHLVKYHPDGLSPYISGTDVIS